MPDIAKRVPIPKNGVDYRGKVVLAPMVRSGECPSRLMALKYGADLVWGPETIDKALIGTVRKINPRNGTVEWTRFSSNPTGRDHDESIIYRLDPIRERGVHIFQLGSANPETAVAAAKLVAADVSGIDLNSGCPKPFSTLGGMGAALLKTPDRLCSILTALVTEVGQPFEIGISVKIRLLDTAEETRALVERLVKTGITGLTIHCRTTPMRPRERAIRQQLRMIGEICRDAGVACLMNGDVTSRAEALQLAAEYEVDGGMIATAAEANPSVFRREEDGGLADYKELMRAYFDYALQVENAWGNTKFYLQQIVPGKKSEHQRMLAAKCFVELAEALDMDQDAIRRARVSDQVLKLGEFAVAKLTKAQRKALNNERQEAAKKRKADEADLDAESQFRPQHPYEQTHTEAAQAVATF